MDTESLKSNLIICINELNIMEGDNIKFRVVPIVENGKSQNSTDDYMRLNILNPKNLENRFFDLDKVVKILSGPHSTFPIWINVEMISNKNTEYIIELKTSVRFRKPSLLRNQETGHPPFRAIIK
ncbi:hypothetical protein [Neobacillus sp. LXY-4]|uniref:hypothetical protein n=1 Tax=Neobacillus sp. LXY-4 TaxID=3379826 RepID=UPI003EE00AFA